MWRQVPTDEFTKRVKRWPKKYRRELGAMLANLQTILSALQAGSKVESLEFGFVHHEPGGVLALDQKGGGAGLKPCRLYTYPHVDEEVLHVITMGDKNSQSEDIKYAKAFADGVKG
jgi:hypothetical protein